MCEYCDTNYDNKEIKTNNTEFEIEVYEGKLDINASMGGMYDSQSGSCHVPINYCPMCGREL